MYILEKLWKFLKLNYLNSKNKKEEFQIDHCEQSLKVSAKSVKKVAKDINGFNIFKYENCLQVSWVASGQASRRAAAVATPAVYMLTCTVLPLAATTTTTRPPSSTLASMTSCTQPGRSPWSLLSTPSTPAGSLTSRVDSFYISIRPYFQSVSPCNIAEG